MQLRIRHRTKNRAMQLTFLNVVVRQGATVLKLLSGEDQSLLVRGNACKGKTPLYSYVYRPISTIITAYSPSLS